VRWCTSPPSTILLIFLMQAIAMQIAVEIPEDDMEFATSINKIDVLSFK